MVEYTAADGEAVEIQRSVKSGREFCSPAAPKLATGPCLSIAGVRLDHAAIAMAASAGQSQAAGFREPRVAVLPTGDEVVEIDAIPGPAQIRNSNTYSLAAQIRDAGGEP